MDGVLVLSEPFHYRSWFLLAEEAGFQMDNFMSFEESIGIAENDVSRKLVTEHNFNDKAENIVKRKREFFLKQVSEKGIPAPAGRDEFLAYCTKNYRVGLVSSSSRDTVESVLFASDLQSCFEFLVTGDDVQNHKPDPEPYLLALKLSGAAPENTIAIEDSQNGIKSAQRAGISVWEFKSNFVDLMKVYKNEI